MNFCNNIVYDNHEYKFINESNCVVYSHKFDTIYAEECVNKYNLSDENCIVSKELIKEHIELSLMINECFIYDEIMLESVVDKIYNDKEISVPFFSVLLYKPLQEFDDYFYESTTFVANKYTHQERAVARKIIEAFNASASAKSLPIENISRVIDKITTKFGYAHKAETLANAIRSVNDHKSNISNITYSVTKGKDQNNCNCLMVCFEFKIEGEKYQVGFHLRKHAITKNMDPDKVKEIKRETRYIDFIETFDGKTKPIKLAYGKRHSNAPSIMAIKTFYGI